MSLARPDAALGAWAPKRVLGVAPTKKPVWGEPTTTLAFGRELSRERMMQTATA